MSKPWEKYSGAESKTVAEQPAPKPWEKYNATAAPAPSPVKKADTTAAPASPFTFEAGEKLRLADEQRRAVGAGMEAGTEFTTALTEAATREIPEAIGTGINYAMKPVAAVAKPVFQTLRGPLMPAIMALNGGGILDAAATVPIEEGKTVVPGLEPGPEERGVVPSIRRAGAALTTPENLLMAPVAFGQNAAGKSALALFGLGSASQIPPAIRAAIEAETSPELQGALTDAALQLAFSTMIAKGMQKKDPLTAPAKDLRSAVRGAEFVSPDEAALRGMNPSKAQGDSLILNRTADESFGQNGQAEVKPKSKAERLAELEIDPEVTGQKIVGGRKPDGSMNFEPVVKNMAKVAEHAKLKAESDQQNNMKKFAETNGVEWVEGDTPESLMAKIQAKQAKPPVEPAKPPVERPVGDEAELIHEQKNAITALLNLPPEARPSFRHEISEIYTKYLSDRDLGAAKASLQAIHSRVLAHMGKGGTAVPEKPAATPGAAPVGPKPAWVENLEKIPEANRNDDMRQRLADYYSGKRVKPTGPGKKDLTEGAEFQAPPLLGDGNNDPTLDNTSGKFRIHMAGIDEPGTVREFNDLAEVADYLEERSNGRKVKRGLSTDTMDYAFEGFDWHDLLQPDGSFKPSLLNMPFKFRWEEENVLNTSSGFTKKHHRGYRGGAKGYDHSVEIWERSNGDFDARVGEGSGQHIGPYKTLEEAKAAVGPELKLYKRYLNEQYGDNYRYDQPYVSYKDWKAKQLPEKTDQAPPGLSDNQARLVESQNAELGIKHGASVWDSFKRIAEGKDRYGVEHSQMADFLMRHYGDALKQSKYDMQTPPKQRNRPEYRHKARTVHGMNEHDFSSTVVVALHEGAHAATVHALEYPKTPRQMLASKAMTALRDYASKNKAVPDIHKHAFDYYFSKDQEFIAGIFSDKNFRDHLASMKINGIDLWTKVKDKIKDLLGIERDTVLSKAFDQLIEAGKDERGNKYDATGEAVLQAPERERLTYPAVRTKDGKIYKARFVDSTHYDVMGSVPANEHATARSGWVTSDGRFVTREQAINVARGAGQLTERGLREWASGRLDALDTDYVNHVKLNEEGGKASWDDEGPTDQAPSATPNYDPIFRYKSAADEKIDSTTPRGLGEVPIARRLFDPRSYKNSPEEKVLVTHQVSFEKAKTAVATWLEKNKLTERAFKVDDTGEVTLADGSKDFMSDVIETELENPGSMPLTPEQKKFVDGWREIMENEIRYAQSEGVKFFLDEKGNPRPIDDLRVYFPRPRIGTHGEPKQKSMGNVPRPGGRPSSFKKRKYETEAEGADKGVLYEPDEFYRAAEWLKNVYRSIADTRLAADPDLKGRLGVRMVPSGIHAPKGGPMTYMKVGKGPGYGEGEVFGVPALSGRVFPQETARKLNSFFNQDVPNSIRIGSYINNALKMVKFTADVSAPLNQGLAMMHYRPIRWAKATALSYGAFAEGLAKGDSKMLARYLSKPENSAAAKGLIENGSSIVRLQDFLAGGEREGLIEKAPDYVQKKATAATGSAKAGKVASLPARAARRVVRASADSMGTFLSIAKVELWKSLEPYWKGSKAELAETIDGLVFSGRMEQIGMGQGRALVERLLFNAPSYARAFGNLVVEAGKDLQGTATGSPKSKVALKALTAMGTGIMTQMFIAYKLQGLSMDEIIERFDPRSGKFMRIQMPTGDGQSVELSYGNIALSAARLVGQFADIAQGNKKFGSGTENNPFLRFMSYRKSPLMDFIWQSLSGKDYQGLPTTWLESLGRLPLPISAEPAFNKNISKKSAAVESAAQFVGGAAFTKERPDMSERARTTFGKELQTLGLRDRLVLARQKSSEPKPSLASQQVAAQAATKNEFERRNDIIASLPKHQTKFLEANKLSMPNFQSGFEIHGEAIPLTRAERQEHMKIVEEEFEKSIQALIDSPNLESFKKDGSLQKRLERILSRAAERSRAILKRNLRARTAQQ